MPKKIILIVEDEGLVAKALQTKLMKFGYACKTICKTGLDAVECAKEENPDLILMDIHLKGNMDGIETAKIIKQGIDVPVIYLTAYANDEILSRAKITDPYAYILKPYKDKDLQVTIEIVLNKFKLEKKIIESEAKYREVVSTSSEGIISTNESGDIILWNKGAQKIFDYRENEVLNKRLSTIILENIDNIIDRSLQNISKEDLSDNEYFGLKSNNELLILEITRSTRYLNSKKIITHFVRNITQRKINERQINKNNRYIKLINKILRHDLANNLSKIKVLLKNVDKEHNKEKLNSIKTILDNSIHLIRKMKDLEIFVSSHKDLKIYSVREVLKKVTDHFEKLHIKINGDNQILADDALSVVFKNIIENAEKHGNASNIIIDIIDRGNSTAIRIADDGSGIPDDIKKNIFNENFSHGANANTGLGLHIVHSVITNYGGKIFVEDNSPQGTVFVIFFRSVSELKK
ncbi:MAG: response regulator [Candidatus Cloacimonetes bacterium]|nr:response regulator [Candidatus Cloacimonadota bacterium]